MSNESKAQAEAEPQPMEASAEAVLDAAAIEAELAKARDELLRALAEAEKLLAFARALYLERPYLILDEATANVDSETEARLQAAVATLIEGRTSIVIAHRLSTIRNADRIVVMYKGRIAELGTHDELIAKGGIYARLHRIQFLAEEDSRISAA